MIQSLILAIYPLLQAEFSLTFVQIGMITLTFQLASSLLQPVVGYLTDKHPMPWSLPIGMCFTLSGLVLLAISGSFGWFCSLPRWSGPDRRSFIRSLLAWRGWPPAVAMAWRSRYSRSAATLAVR
jgi:MFS family permease